MFEWSAHLAKVSRTAALALATVLVPATLARADSPGAYRVSPAAYRYGYGSRHWGPGYSGWYGPRVHGPAVRVVPWGYPGYGWGPAYGFGYGWSRPWRPYYYSGYRGFNPYRPYPRWW
jgi:hypothetical protein